LSVSFDAAIRKAASRDIAAEANARDPRHHMRVQKPPLCG